MEAELEAQKPVAEALDATSTTAHLPPLGAPAHLPPAGPEGLAPSESSVGQLSAASGSLAGAGISSRHQSSVSRAQLDDPATATRSLSLQPPPEAAPSDGSQAAVPEPEANAVALEADHASSMGPADGIWAGGDDASTHTGGDSVAQPPAAPIEHPAQLDDGEQTAGRPASQGSSMSSSSSRSSARQSGSRRTSSGSSGSTHESPPPPAPKLSVWQLMQAREKAAADAAAASGGSPPSARTSARTAHHGAVAAGSGTASPLASSRSSPNVAGPSRRRPAAVAAASSAGSAAPSSAYGSRPGSPGAEASAGASSCGSTGCTLLQPTASFVARVEETKSLKQLRLQAGLPSAFQPKETEVRPFALSCDEHARCDHTRVNAQALLTREEREALEVEKGRQELARELRGARERCRRTLSCAPQRHTPQREVQPPQFSEFHLRSAERHAAYAQQFASKVAAEQRAEDEMHRSPSHGSRSPSRIGALHGPSGGSPPMLATGERATRHEVRSAERRQREEREALEREGQRLAQLTLQEREEEEERWQRRFKARGMPDFTSQPVFTPDKRKAKPATVPRGFSFSTAVRAAAKPPAGPAEQHGSDDGAAASP